MNRGFTSVQRVVQQRLREVRWSNAWAEIHAISGVGLKVGLTLQFRGDEHETLRRWAIREYGADPGQLDRDKDRVALSLNTGNEKLSKQRAFGRLLRVAVPGHGVLMGRLAGTPGQTILIPTPPGMLLAIDPEQLMFDSGRIKRVLVIENGQLMERWWELVPLLPERWREETLLAYRGHRQDQRALIKWVRQHREYLELGFYGDFDPHGIRIGLRSYEPLALAGRFTLIGPASTENIPRQVNKGDTYISHEPALRYLEKRVPRSSGARPLIDNIRQGRWAVTQEALLVHGIPLREYQL